MRAAKALAFFTSGYKKTLADVVGQGVFADGVPNNMVLVKDMDVHSLCEHHMIPFTGKVTNVTSCFDCIYSFIYIACIAT